MSIRRAVRMVGGAASLVLLYSVSCALASGYYNFVYFTSRNAPFQPVPARFDLTQLAGGTVSYFISDQPPSAMMPGDSYAGIVSQIRSAAAVWNGVSTSALRLSYGGISTVGTPQSTPGVDVVFDDNMPPGLLAQTRVTTPTDVSFLASANPATAFVPLQRSKVQLRSNLTATVGIVNGEPSYSELFYTTLVHELGHSLGLQHSLVSGAMATYVTRATTKGHPLTADDVAAVSMLYPAPGYVVSTGSISGRVTLGGGGVNLASVVALATNGAAISALTNPDGTYSINGIPPGSYYVYVHPLPPPQTGEAYPDNVVPPVDLQENPFAAATGFVTQLYNGTPSGTRDWTQASQIPVVAGAAAPGVNFAVQGSAGPAVYNLQTYVYQGAGALVPVPSPYVVAGSRQYLVFTGNGVLASASALTPGLSVSAIGNAARVEAATLAYYQQGFAYEVIDAGQVPAGVPQVPVALAVTTGTDLYILPAAVTVTANAAPSVSAVNTSGGQGTVNVAGTNLTPATAILFDGAAGTVVQQNSDGSLVVTAPPATGAYRAFVEAVNPVSSGGDGQSSAQALGSAQPPVLAYPAQGNALIQLSTGAFAAGEDTSITLTGINATFADGQAVLGFGSSDVQVRRVWMQNGNVLVADVSVSPQASPGTVTVSVADGLQLVTQPGILQVVPANQGQISLRAPVVDAVTGLAGVSNGGSGVAVMAVSGLPASAVSNETLAAGWTLSVGGVTVNSGPSLVATPNQIRVLVPNNVATGPQPVQLVSPTGASIPSIYMQVDAPPPSLGAIAGPTGNPTAAVGDLVSITVFNLAGDGSSVPVTLSNVIVLVNGVGQTVSGLTALGSANTYSVQFTLSGALPLGQDSVTVGLGTRRSQGVFLQVHN